MPSKTTYTLGGLTFTSKAAAEHHAQDILYAYAPPAVLNDHDLQFVLDMLAYHRRAAEKIGLGVQAIWIKRNQWGDATFQIERIDGTWADFSYRKCLAQENHASKVKAALRFAIKDQTAAVARIFFADCDTAICEVSGEPFTRMTAHVDHIPPRTFVALVSEWMDTRGLSFDNIDVVDGHRGEGNILADPFIERDWCEYHRAHALLRVISAEANMRLVK